MRRLLLAALVAGLIQPAAAATDFEPNLANVIEAYIQPATGAFADTAAALPGAVEAACQTPDVVTERQFETAFSETVGGFALVQFLRFGPVLDSDRLSRLAFLPDPRGITQRQLRKLLAAREADALDAETLKNKSVAVQGLTALEQVAFDKEGNVRLGQQAGNDFSCSYAKAISENVAAIAAEIAAEWQDPDGYSKLLLTAEAGNERFHTSKEALESVFNALVTGLIIVRDQDIEPALGGSREKARANRFPFSRSGNSAVYLSSELLGLHDAIEGLDLKDLTPEEFTWIFGTLDFEFKNAQTLLDALHPPLRETFEEGEAYDKVVVLAITVSSLQKTVGQELAGALGLSGGFNSLDGD
ncbi:imelysin family protein [Roseibium sp. M-1]